MSFSVFFELITLLQYCVTYMQARARESNLSCLPLSLSVSYGLVLCVEGNLGAAWPQLVFTDSGMRLKLFAVLRIESAIAKVSTSLTVLLCQTPGPSWCSLTRECGSLVQNKMKRPFHLGL